MKLVTACLLVARLTQLVGAACGASKLQGGMTTCQMKLGTGGGDFCSRYNAYTKCIDDLLAPCPASMRNAFSSSMQAATAAYSSELDKCSSSGSGSVSVNEKPSVSGSNSGNENQATSCSSTELQKQ